MFLCISDDLEAISDYYTVAIDVQCFLRKIQEEFQKRCGALKCRDLKAITDGKALCPCEDCVRNAVMIYGEFIGI